jgi:hypothetical protein
MIIKPVDRGVPVSKQTIFNWGDDFWEALRRDSTWISKCSKCKSLWTCPRQSNLYEYMEHLPVNDFSIDFIWKCTLSSRISRPCLMTSKPAKKLRSPSGRPTNQTNVRWIPKYLSCHGIQHFHLCSMIFIYMYICIYIYLYIYGNMGKSENDVFPKIAI